MYGVGKRLFCAMFRKPNFLLSHQDMGQTANTSYLRPALTSKVPPYYRAVNPIHTWVSHLPNNQIFGVGKRLFWAMFRKPITLPNYTNFHKNYMASTTNWNYLQWINPIISIINGAFHFTSLSIYTFESPISNLATCYTQKSSAQKLEGQISAGMTHFSWHVSPYLQWAISYRLA